MLIRGVVLASCLLAFLLGDATVARADVSGRERQTTADLSRLLSRAIDDHVFQLSPLAPAKFRRPWDATQGVTKTQLARCESKKKGMIVGAIIGAVAGAAIGVYVSREVSGQVFGASNGASTYIAYWSLGGAGAGALGGLAYCR